MPNNQPVKNLRSGKKMFFITLLVLFIAFLIFILVNVLAAVNGFGRGKLIFSSFTFGRNIFTKECRLFSDNRMPFYYRQDNSCDYED